MAVSTFFEDTKVAQNIMGILYIFPIIIFFGLVLKDSSAKQFVYCLFLMPIGPSATILMQLTTRTIDGEVIAIAHVDFVNRYVAYAALIF